MIYQEAQQFVSDVLMTVALVIFVVSIIGVIGSCLPISFRRPRSFRRATDVHHKEVR